MADKCVSHRQEEINLQAKQLNVHGELERLRVEVVELRASLKRLVVAADADRRMVERELHDGVHQHLIALAVNVQLAAQALASDPGAAKPLLDEMGRDLQDALDETSRLAQRIYPETPEAGGLGTLLRSAAVTAGVPASVDVAAPSTHPPEVVMTLYLCWFNTLARGRGQTDARIRVRESEDMLAFEVVGTACSEAGLDYLRDRVEALGGRLAVTAESADRTRVSGSLPLAR
ncbi:MAG: sensor histidine kinase [Gaiellaceae bacterium]